MSSSSVWAPSRPAATRQATGGGAEGTFGENLEMLLTTGATNMTCSCTNVYFLKKCTVIALHPTSMVGALVLGVLSARQHALHNGSS